MNLSFCGKPKGEKNRGMDPVTKDSFQTLMVEAGSASDTFWDFETKTFDTVQNFVLVYGKNLFFIYLESSIAENDIDGE